MDIRPQQRAAMFRRAANILAPGLGSVPSKLIVVIGAGVSVASANAASWADLIRNCCNFADDEIPGLDRGYIDSVRRMVDQQRLVKAADRLRSNLTPAEFGLFLKDQFEKLRSSEVDPALYRILETLRLAGARLTTTNYDTLIEDNLALGRMDWTDEVLDRFFTSKDALRNRPVLHIHGMWIKPKDVIFSSDDYAAITDPQRAKPGRKDAVERLQFWLHTAFASSHILFVGCGETASDPHFTRLFDFAERVRSGEDKRHVYLCTDEVYEALRDKVHDSVMMLPYGPDYHGLGPGVQHIFTDLFDSNVGPLSGLARGSPGTPAQANHDNIYNSPPQPPNVQSVGADASGGTS